MEYELTIITPDNITDKEIDDLKAIVKKHAKKIWTTEDDGVKKLAYPITCREQEHERGHYLFWQLDMPTDEPQKIASEFNINDNVMRFLLVKSDSNYGHHRSK